MRSFTFARFAASTLLAAAAPMFATAAAGEMLVMPYACQMRGGAPLLTPARDQGYRILGAREQREFTACSPANPDMCRRWTLHRFDIECGGRRVAWTSVSAAADAMAGGRSWVDGGRFNLEMPPRWGMRRDDPCARGPRAWRFAPMRRDCAERRAAARTSVAMPAGYAPLLGLDAIFVADDGVPAPEDRTAAVRAPVAPPPPKPTRVEEPAPRAAEKPAAKPPSSTPPARELPSEPETTMAASTPLAPTIINKPDAPSAKPEPAPDRAESDTPLTTSSFADAKAALAATRQSEADDAPAASGATPAVDTRDPQAGGAPSAGGPAPPLSPALLGVGGVTVLGLLALLLAARRSEAQPDLALARDIAAVSLDGRPRARGLARSGGRWLAASRPRTAAAQDAFPASTLGDSIPQTRAQALQVLGMGVAPDVSDSAIKKIVDGLRLSWHPDYAKDPQDRALRELRMKQINAAWDIVNGKRAG